jgi:hypothetical protein
MAKGKNPNSLLFLYEGETEGEFYQMVFNKYIPSRKIRRNYSNLKGIYNLNDKIAGKIDAYLLNQSFLDCNKIHVFIACDREGPREKESLVDMQQLTAKYIYNGSRISSINEIIATQDLESWFFHDLEGIYRHLKVSKTKRNLAAFNNIEATNNRILSSLFHRHGKHYQKGKRVSGFLNRLDIEKIFSKVEELKDSVKFIKTLC